MREYSVELFEVFPSKGDSRIFTLFLCIREICFGTNLISRFDFCWEGLRIVRFESNFEGDFFLAL